MILFLYGEDTFRLQQKLKQLKEKFISSSLGDTNLAVLEGDTISYDELVRQVLAYPFLANSRLVIVRNILSEGKKELQEKVGELLEKVPSTTVLVFAEFGTPDKRTSLFKKLNKPKLVQEFKPLEGIELEKWIEIEATNRGASTQSDAIARLIQSCGNDLWRISNELDKLTTYSLKLTVNVVDLLVPSQESANIFDLIDTIANKNATKALRELHILLESGENELYILSMIVYQYRNLLIVKDLQEKSNRSLSSWDLAKKAGLHPFVAQKTTSQAQNYSFENLKEIYTKLVDFDVRIKTGKIDSKTALDLLVAKLCV